MNDLIINKTMGFIENNSNYNNTDIKRIRYGLEGVYLTITKLIIIFLIGIIFNYLDIILLTLLFFNFLRFFAFGLHAKKSIHCLIISISLFNILPLILLNIKITNTLIFIISFISITSFILFAPSDTEKRPLTNKRKRIIRKILAIITGIIYIIICLYSNYFKVPILCSLIIESIVINPISYKLLGLSYNNYKRL